MGNIGNLVFSWGLVRNLGLIVFLNKCMGLGRKFFSNCYFFFEWFFLYFKYLNLEESGFVIFFKDLVYICFVILDVFWKI